MNDTTLTVTHDDELLLDIAQLYAHLAQIPDQRQARGKRYPLPLLLMVIILAKLSGENTPTAISEWAQLRQTQLQTFFGYRRAVKPSHNTIRRTMANSVTDEALQQYTRQYLHQVHGGQQSLLVVLDGKVLRGTIPSGETQGVHLLAAYLPEEGVVLKQVDVGCKENEIRAAPHLLGELDLKGRTVSGDALFAQRSLSVQVLAQGGDYIWMVKGNQPTLEADVARFFEPLRHAAGWHRPAPTQATACDRGKAHGRIEMRRLTVIPDDEAYLDWPGIRQVFELERRVIHPKRGTETRELFYGITSCAHHSDSAAQLLAWTRQHWGIENGLHYRRDVTLAEDATRMKNRQQARVLATLNNFVIALVRCLGFNNLAAARRLFHARLDEALFSP